MKHYMDGEELFRAVISNDQLAIKQYYESIIEKLFGYVHKSIKNKEVATDIANECFAKTLVSGVSFNDLNHISAYMFIKANYACKDYLKKKSAPPHIAIETEELYLTDSQRIEHEMIMADFCKLILAQIEKLPKERDQQIIKDLYIYQFTTEEVAERIGCSTQYVLNRKQKALKLLKNQLINKIIWLLILLFMHTYVTNAKKNPVFIELRLTFHSLSINSSILNH